MKWFNFTASAYYGFKISDQLPFTVDAVGDPVLNTNNQVVRNFALQKGVVIPAFFWESDTVKLDSEFFQLF